MVRVQGPFDGDGGQPIRIELARSVWGFKGATLAQGFNLANPPCPVRFPTEVLECSAEGLTLRSAATAAYDEACQPLAQPESPAWVTHSLKKR